MKWLSIFIDADKKEFHSPHIQIAFANMTLNSSDLTSHLLAYLATYCIIELRFDIGDISVLAFQANKNTAMKAFKMISSHSTMYL